MRALKVPEIELISIGDEVLLGEVGNRAVRVVGGGLARRGMRLRRAGVVTEDEMEIGLKLKLAWERSDIVIVTGGLGSIRTVNIREVGARVLGEKLVMVESVREKMERMFREMGRVMGNRHLRLCYRLERSEVLENRLGMSPGLWYEREGKIVIFLPGMVSEMEAMMEEEVVPRLQDRGYLKLDRVYLQIRAMGVSEEEVEKLLGPVWEANAGLEVRYTVKQGVFDIRLISGAMGYSWEELMKVGMDCKYLLGQDFVCFGHERLEEIVCGELRKIGKKLAVAESCTGGKISDMLTNVAGASEVFMGGVVAYGTEVKRELLGVPEELIRSHGVVSEQVAIAMACGVAKLMKADYGLGITGFAGPGGGTEENPVGTVYIGYYSPMGIGGQRVYFPGQREVVKGRAANAGLDYIRRLLI